MITLALIATLSACLAVIATCAFIAFKTTSSENHKIACAIGFWTVIFAICASIVWSIAYHYFCFVEGLGYGCAVVDWSKLLG